MTHGGIQGDRFRKNRWRHQVGKKRRLCWCKERVCNPVDENKKIDPVKRHFVGGQRNPHPYKRNRVKRSRRDEDVSPLELVYHESCQEKENEYGKNKYEAYQRELEGIACDLVDMPTDCDRYHLHRQAKANPGSQKR